MTGFHLKKRLENQEMEISCPKCQHGLKEKIGQLRKNPILVCPMCSAKIQIRVDDSDLKKFDKASDKLDKTLKDMQKNRRITIKM